MHMRARIKIRSSARGNANDKSSRAALGGLKRVKTWRLFFIGGPPAILMVAKVSFRGRFFLRYLGGSTYLNCLCRYWDPVKPDASKTGVLTCFDVRPSSICVSLARWIILYMDHNLSLICYERILYFIMIDFELYFYKEWKWKTLCFFVNLSLSIAE